MYKKQQPSKTSIHVNASYYAERLERKLERMINNGEPIGDGAAITYTERQDGVLPQLDPRTDRWELAVEARDKLAKTHLAQREQLHGERTFDTMTPEQQKQFSEKFPNSKYKPMEKNQGT